MLNPYGWIAYQATRVPEHAALVDIATDRTLTYRDLEDRVSRLAGYFYSQGLKHGDRVAVLAQNSSNVFEILYASALAGVIAVPLNWRLSDHELCALVDDCTPAALLYDESFASRSAGLIAHGSISTSVRWGGSDDAYESAVRTSDRFVRTDVVDGDAGLVIIYTSGTTGRPKGVVHTVASVTANVENSAYAGDVHGESVSLTVLPTFHVAGLHLFANAALLRGGTAVIMPSFSPEATLAALRDRDTGVSHFCGVPALFQIMSTQPDFADARFDGVVTAVGGSPVPSSLLQEWSAKGANMMSVYGISEAGSTVLAMSDSNRTTAETAVGIPVINARCSVRGSDEAEVAPGEVGELFVSGPMLAREYWNRPEDTAAAFSEGWLRTGDAAMIDTDGFVHIVDRWKDMYISGGENVYPAEIENVLYQHPDVLLAAVVGTAHERWGEVGVAFIVLTDGASCTEEDLLRWCEPRLAKYKTPQQFTFVDDLPRNATGKIVKANLRKQSL